MISIDQLLSRAGVRREELTKEEEQSFLEMYELAKKNDLSVQKIKDIIDELVQNLSLKVSEWDTPKHQDIYIKARLRNYLVLQGALNAKDRVLEQLGDALKNNINGGGGRPL